MDLGVKPPLKTLKNSLVAERALWRELESLPVLDVLAEREVARGSDELA
ncbi:hypothetical protein A2U01_0110202, partial [Trifolium medium]|nr:hypothetical protein [Trifolium medium]